MKYNNEIKEFLELLKKVPEDKQRELYILSVGCLMALEKLGLVEKQN